MVFCFLYLDLEFLIRVRSFEPLHTKIPTISCFSARFVYLQTVISSIFHFIKRLRVRELLFLDWDVGLLYSSRVPNFAVRKLFWFGLRVIGILQIFYSRAVLQRRAVDFFTFLETGLTGKRSVCAQTTRRKVVKLDEGIFVLSGSEL